MYIPRTIESLIKSQLYKNKVLIIYGPRQVGKTTLIKKVTADLKVSSRYFNCDELDVRQSLSEAETSTHLKNIIGDDKVIIFDEAQRIKNIGIKLKLIIDNFPDQQIIATGSSSFELANEVVEPLTGRNFQFHLYPLSMAEIGQVLSRLEINRQLNSFLIYGSYPTVFQSSSLKEKTVLVKQLASDYLYKDILKFQKIRRSELVDKLLVALALQIGNEVSYNEFSNLLGASKQVVASYIDILEKAFIIFKHKPFSRNLRKEIAKSRKIFFWDLGIRNALINNFNSLSLRSDVGALWENFIVVERRKKQFWVGNEINSYFWRTYDRQEIDLIEESGGKLTAFEIKWKGSNKDLPEVWKKTYKNSSWKVVSSDNYLDFLL